MALSAGRASSAGPQGASPMSDLVFYTNPMSRGRIIRWMLEEVGATYRTEIIGYGSAMKEPAYRAINPLAKVPALVHRGVTVTETISEASVETMKAMPSGTNNRPSMPGSANSGTNTSTTITVA